MNQCLFNSCRLQTGHWQPDALPGNALAVVQVARTGALGFTLLGPGADRMINSITMDGANVAFNTLLPGSAATIVVRGRATNGTDCSLFNCTVSITERDDRREFTVATSV